MPRHRVKKVKRVHQILKGFEEPLEEIASLEYVKAVIPGRIKRKKSTGRPGRREITFQYPTPSGAKLLAKGEGAVQEIFVVTSEPEKLKEFLGTWNWGPTSASRAREGSCGRLKDPHRC